MQTRTVMTRLTNGKQRGNERQTTQQRTTNDAPNEWKATKGQRSGNEQETTRQTKGKQQASNGPRSVNETANNAATDDEIVKKVWNEINANGGDAQILVDAHYFYAIPKWIFSFTGRCMLKQSPDT